MSYQDGDISYTVHCRTFADFVTCVAGKDAQPVFVLSAVNLQRVIATRPFWSGVLAEFKRRGHDSPCGLVRFPHVVQVALYACSSTDGMPLAATQPPLMRRERSDTLLLSGWPQLMRWLTLHLHFAPSRSAACRGVLSTRSGICPTFALCR